jgi:ferritin-like metal-binding protein YciE
MATQTNSKKSTATASKKAAGSASKSKSNSDSGKSSKSSMSTDNQNYPLLEKFFIEELKDIYWAEKALTKALPKLAKACTTEQLKDAFTDHLEATKEHVARLEQVFEMFGKKAQAKKCEAMEGLQKEAESIIEDTEEGSMTRDVALIIAAQKVEHYEIATYGGLTQLAKTMNLTEVAELLGQTLQEEKETDELLTYIAENDINMEAEMEGSEEESD